MALHPVHTYTARQHATPQVVLPGIAALECTPACFTGHLKGRRPGSFGAGSLDTYGASSFINRRAYQWCGQLCVHEPVECA
jgi:hypothetical protein